MPYPKKSVTVITPLWNEAANIPNLARRLTGVFAQLDVEWEWISVDDGSTDETLAEARKAIPCANRWQSIALSRNFGLQPAYRAGLEAARGDAVIFLDADMQDPPEAIPDLLNKWREGAQVVIGRRRTRPERGLRGFCMRLFHFLFEWLTDGLMPRDSGTFGLMDRAVVQRMLGMPELAMFLPAMRCWVGFKRAEIFYDRAARQDQPKQSLSKLVNYALDGMVGFSTKPLRFISYIGLAISLLSFSYAGFLLALKVAQWLGFFEHLKVLGFTTLAVAIFCLSGVQLICLGILGEYVARIFADVKRRPPFIVSAHEVSD
jgi:dolichol-phosphate mannosyltransferase